MAAPVDTRPARPAPHTPRNDLAIVAVAVALAIAAALAAQMGVPKAQPVVGAVVILGIAYTFSTDRRAIDRRTVPIVLGTSVSGTSIFAIMIVPGAVMMTAVSRRSARMPKAM